MEEELIKKYVIKGGKFFSVTFIDTIRDGGTKIIKCSNEIYYYINKYSNKFHFAYPTSDKNLINDNLLINYIIDRMTTYIKRLEEDLQRNKNLLKEITIINADSELELIYACGDCGEKLTLVRPGKHQCDNINCIRNEKLKNIL